MFGSEFVLLPSDERLILIGGSSGTASPAKKVIAAIKDPPKKLPFNEALNKLVASADRRQLAWLAMTVSKSYRELPLLKPVKAFTANVQRQDDFTLVCTMQAHGDSEDEMKAILGVFDMSRDWLVKETEDETRRDPAMQLMVDLAKSAARKQEGKTVTVTVKHQAKSKQPLSALLLPIAASFGRW
jgi:hypothetical protein